jgi:peptide deformylase
MTNSELGLIMLTNDLDGILRKSADMVDLEDIKNIQELIDLMLKKTYELGAMGLAAPQIGISKQIFVLSDGTVCINPTIVGRSGKITSYAEGCLSVGEQRFDIKRSRDLKIKFLDRFGESQMLKPKNKLISITIQHEMDHLNGKLVCDRGRPRT